MAVIPHDDQPKHAVPRITTRVLVGSGSGATATAVWEQWLAPEGFIPLHYHEVEEVLVILAGQVELTLGAETMPARAPATILVPPQASHALKPVGPETVHLLAFFPTATPKIYAPDGSERPMPWQDR